MFSLKLAWKLLRRDWVSGELKILIASLLVAVTAISSINFFSERIHIGMIEEASTFIGADLQLTGSRKADDLWLQKAEQFNLEMARSFSFASVTASEDAFQLTDIRAVDTKFPLKGQIKVRTDLSNSGNSTITTNSKPSQGFIWIDQRLVNKLKVTIGDLIEVGSAELAIAGVIESKPGRGGSLLSFFPTIVMNMADVPLTKVLQPGSRIRWRYQFIGSTTDINQFSQWLEDQIDDTWQVVGGSASVPNLEKTLSRAKGFLSLASLASLLLAGIAIAMVSNRYAEHHFDHVALLRCFGASQALVLKVYSLNLFVLGIVTSILGSLSGYYVHLGLVQLMQSILPTNLPLPTTQSFFVAIATGMVALVGFALPALIRLGSIPPLRVLRRDIDATEVKTGFTYLLTVLSLAVIMWWLTSDLTMVLILLAGGVVAGLVLMLLSAVFLYVGLMFQASMSGAVRFGFSQLGRHDKASMIQVMAFGLAIFIMMLIFLLRTDLLDAWSEKQATDTPNHFVVNIEPSQIPKIETFFKQRSIKTSGLFPMIRSRAKLPESATGEIKRELNITWSLTLPSHNKLEQGEWSPQSTASGLPAISIEQSFAERMGLKIGDIIEFDTAGRIYKGEITSSRSVKWDSFKPNFFIIFTSNAIEDMPADWMTSFYLDPQRKAELRQLVELFPAITLIELDSIMKQIQRIIEQVSIAIEYILLFVIIAGLMVLLATVQSSMDERRYEATVLRTLGASRRYIRLSILTEFGLLGLLSGLMAALGTELVSYGLYERLFDLPYTPHLWLWFIGPASGIIIISTTGYMATKNVINRPPMSSFRQVN